MPGPSPFSAEDALSQIPREEHAEVLVAVGCVALGGPWHVHLRWAAQEHLLIGPYPNRLAAIAEASRVRQRLAEGVGRVDAGT